MPAMTPRKSKDSCACCLYRLTRGNPIDHLSIEFLSGQHLAFCVVPGNHSKQLIEDAAVDHNYSEQVCGVRQRVRSETKTPCLDLATVEFAGQATRERPGRIVDRALLAAIILRMTA